MLSVTLFGSAHFELQAQGSPRFLRLSPRVAELLAFLAVHRNRSFHRADLCDVIWGERDDPGSVASVNTALWRLRKVLEPTGTPRGDYLVMDYRRAISLNGRRHVDVDVTEFESLARRGLAKPLELMAAEDADALREAVRRYTGIPLADFRTVWALKYCERLRTTMLDVLSRLMQLSDSQKLYDDAIKYAREILEFDPLREDIHASLMSYFALNGQRTLALRQFEACRALLHQDLAVSPLPETIALYRAIANHGSASRSILVPTCRTPNSSSQGIEENMHHKTHAALSGFVAPGRQISILRSLIAEVDSHLRQMLSQIDG
jgi:DNA-binding SARP family transcriptional activator